MEREVEKGIGGISEGKEATAKWGPRGRDGKERSERGRILRARLQSIG